MDEARPTPARPGVAAPSSASAPASSVASLESLTLTQALALLDAHHPELDAFRCQVEAASERAEAAGALPAPVVIVRAENVPLHRGRSLDQGNYIAGLALSLPLQGRLGAARSVEEREGELVSRELEQRRHALLRGTRRVRHGPGCDACGRPERGGGRGDRGHGRHPRASRGAW